MLIVRIKILTKCISYLFLFFIVTLLEYTFFLFLSISIKLKFRLINNTSNILISYYLLNYQNYITFALLLDKNDSYKSRGGSDESEMTSEKQKEEDERDRWRKNRRVRQGCRERMMDRGWMQREMRKNRGREEASVFR